MKLTVEVGTVLVKNREMTGRNSVSEEHSRETTGRYSVSEEYSRETTGRKGPNQAQTLPLSQRDKMAGKG